jgi:arylsulfatase
LFGIKGDKNTVENYDEWARVGGWTSSYGQGWANLSNAPFRRYKRENHEGGISAPFIVHWPAKIGEGGGLRNQVAHLNDLMPTFVEVSGAEYPAKFEGHAIQPMEGMSLVPSFSEAEPVSRTLFWEHEGNRAVREGDWKLVGSRNGPWELYDMSRDRTELNDLIAVETELAKELQSLWEGWASEVNVLTPDEFERTRKEHNETLRKARAAAKKPQKQ